MFELVYFLVFGAVLVMFVYVIGSNLSEYFRNNAAPQETADATIVGKREVVHHHHNQNGIHTSYSHYATFEFANGERIELRMRGKQAGLLVEGDRGRLSWQGNRFLGFERYR